jgi:hypothetical protein
LVLIPAQTKKTVRKKGARVKRKRALLKAKGTANDSDLTNRKKLNWRLLFFRASLTNRNTKTAFVAIKIKVQSLNPKTLKTRSRKNSQALILKSCRVFIRI